MRPRGGLADGLANLARAKAPGADPDAAMPSVLFDDADALEVGQPDLLRHVVGVTDHVAEAGTLLTGLTDTRHDSFSKKPRIVTAPGRTVNRADPTGKEALGEALEKSRWTGLLTALDALPTKPILALRE